ncbi:hypothetical protein [Streptomyces sp. IBSBF 2950]|uniref:hypothetical protein n=1 Tax=Streptomyces sp. IBSBF 2950 TaxID=2903528 RepID=UPI002FDBC202
MTATDTLAQQLTNAAQGSPNREAAVWLLAEHGHWLPELQRAGLITARQVPDQADLNWGGTAWHTAELIGTASEFQVLGIARALVHPDLQTGLNDLTRLDEDNRRLVLHALAWASGGRAWAKSLRLLGGLRCGTCDRSLKGMAGKDVTAHMREQHGVNV